MTLAALVTRDRLLTIGMLILCAVAAFALARSDVVECLLGKWTRLRQTKKKPDVEPDFAHPKPKHAPRLVVDAKEHEPHPMPLLHESFGSDLSCSMSRPARVWPTAGHAQSEGKTQNDCSRRRREII